MTIRIGILGSGNWAMRNHLPALALIRDRNLFGEAIDLAAICESDDDRAEAAMSGFGIGRRIASPEELFRAGDIDAFAIVVRPARVGALARLAQQSGKPFLIEKPTGLNAAEARALADAVSVPNVVGFNRRYFPIVRQLRNAVQGLSGPAFIQASFYRHARKDSAVFAADPHCGEFPFMMGTGIHMLNLCEFLFGQIVSCETERIPAQPDGAEAWVIAVRFAGGSHMRANILPTTGTQLERMEVHTPDTSIFARFGLYGEVDGTGRIELHRGGKLVECWDGDGSEPLISRGFVAEYLDLLGAVRGGKTASNVANAFSSLHWAEVIEGRSVQRSELGQEA